MEDSSSSPWGLGRQVDKAESIQFHYTIGNDIQLWWSPGTFVASASVAEHWVASQIIIFAACQWCRYLWCLNYSLLLFNQVTVLLS